MPWGNVAPRHWQHAANSGASRPSPACCAIPAAKMNIVTCGRPAPSPVSQVSLDGNLKCRGFFIAIDVFVFSHVIMVVFALIFLVVITTLGKNCRSSVCLHRTCPSCTWLSIAKKTAEDAVNAAAPIAYTKRVHRVLGRQDRQEDR